MWLSVSCSSYRSRESRIERNSKYRRHIELPTAGIVILRPDLASCHFSDRCTDCTESLGQLRDLTYSARSYSSERADQGGKGKEGEGREGFRHFFFSMDGKKNSPSFPPGLGRLHPILSNTLTSNDRGLFSLTSSQSDSAFCRVVCCFNESSVVCGEMC